MLVLWGCVFGGFFVGSGGCGVMCIGGLCEEVERLCW